MLNRVKSALGGLAAACALLVAASPSAAEPLLVEPAGIRAVWSPMSFTNGLVTIRCAVTLEARFRAETITPTPGAVVGTVTRASTSGCSGGTVSFLTGTLPWNLEFQSFTGTLPEITGVELEVIGAAVQATAGGVTCLFQSTGGSPLKALATIRSGAVEVTGLRADETAPIPIFSGGFLCGVGGGRVAGTATVTDASGTSEVDVALLNEQDPLTFAPDPIDIDMDGPLITDVTVEATSARTLGTLTIVGRQKDKFGVSEGCDAAGVGPNPEPRECRITVSYTELIDEGAAFVRVPVDGLHRLARVGADT